MKDYDPKERVIAPYTTVSLMPSESHVLIQAHGEHRIELDREAITLLLKWLKRAGFVEEDVWPGVRP